MPFPRSALDDDSGEQQEIAELPIDLDIEVEAVALDDTEIDQLRQDTQYAVEPFSSREMSIAG